MWEKYLGEFPFFTVVIGDVGEGKTATALSIIDEYRNEYQPYIVANKSVYKQYPEWMKRVDPRNLKVYNDSIIFIDDIHLYYQAREWTKDRAKLLSMLSRERRQVNTAIVATTQEARVVDINLLSMLSCLILKKPSLFQRKYERSEIKPQLTKAHAALGGMDLDARRKKAYIISDVADFEGIIDVIQPPWFTDEISKAHRDFFGAPKVDTSKAVKNISSILRVIGRFRG